MKRTPLKRGKPLARTAGPTRRTRKPKRFADRRDEGYCRWIRTLICCVQGRMAGAKPCVGWVECAHVVSRGAGGFDVANTVPLCTGHHRQQHAIGLRSFEKMYRISLANKALYYGAIQPPKYERDWPGGCGFGGLSGSAGERTQKS
jgi:hypothetical protein